MTREFDKLEKEGATKEKLEELGTGKLRAAAVEGDMNWGSVMMGQVAGLIDEDFELLKQFLPWSYFTSAYYAWIPMVELLHDAGAKVVVATRFLPDTFKLLPVNISGSNIIRMGTKSLFPYIAHPWLTSFMEKLSQGKTIKQIVDELNEEIADPYKELGIIYGNIKDYIDYLIWGGSIINGLYNTIYDILDKINESSKWIGLIDRLINAYMDVASLFSKNKDYSAIATLFNDYYLQIFDYYKTWLTNDLLIDIHAALGWLHSYMDSLFIEYENVAQYFRNKFNTIWYGDGDYKLEPIEPPSTPSPPPGSDTPIPI